MDELNDETEARMDELEDRTRVLAARVDAAEKRAKALAEELAGCGNSENSHACGACANCYRVGMREALDARGRAIAERDAAVKAKEEAEARADALRYLTRAEKAEIEAASLRVQVDCGQDGVCAVAPGCNRHWEERNRELAAQLEQVRADLHEWATPPKGMGASLHAVTWPALTPSARRRMLRLAALSPSPASLARFFGVPAEALVPHEGPVTYEPKTTLPEPASGVVGGKACARCVECGHLREEHEYGYGACQHGSCDHCTYFHEPPTPAPGKDGAR